MLIAVAGVSACGRFGHDQGPSQDEQLQRILDENASFTVFLRSDVTAAQRKNIEAALRALPGATGVSYTDHDGAYQKMKRAFSAEPSTMPRIDPAILPESFEIRMTDIAAVRKARDNKAAVRDLPGVQEVVFTCLTVPECRKLASPQPTASPT